MQVELYKQTRTYKSKKDGKEHQTTDLLLSLPMNSGQPFIVRIAPAFKDDKSAWALLYGYASEKQ